MSTLRHRRHHFPILITLVLILTQGHQQLQEALASPTSQLTPLAAAANRRPFLHYLVQNWDNGRTMRYYHVNHGGDNNRHYVLGDMAVLNNAGGDQQLAVPVKRATKSGLKGGGGYEDDMIVGGQDYGDYGTQQQLYEDVMSFHPRKRGFSVLARWKPFTNIHKLRVSNRQQQQQMLRPALIHHAQVQHLLSSAAAADDYDVISAETRALLLRPSGQPLRWG